MTGEQHGLLHAARRARDIADEWDGAAERSPRKRREDIDIAQRHRERANEWRAFAAWCELEADTYTGASLVLMPSV